MFRSWPAYLAFAAIPLAAACGSSPVAPSSSAPPPPTAATPPPSPAVPSPGPSSLQTTIAALYQQELGVDVPVPAVFNDARARDCNGVGHLTTTTYLTNGRTSTLLFLYTERDGSAVRRRERTTTLTPAGTHRTLTALIRYPNTYRSDTPALWDAAVRRVNDDYAEYASRLGWAPLVTLDNTTVVVDRANVSDPQSPAAVRAALQQQGVSTAGYDVILSIAIDPSRVDGGEAGRQGEMFIYVGRFDSWWTGPLGEGEWVQVARVAFHHELVHLWGWPGTHDWASACDSSGHEMMAEFRPFLVPPMLLGWTDVDGDGAAEIIDPTPYGRR